MEYLHLDFVFRMPFLYTLIFFILDPKSYFWDLDLLGSKFKELRIKTEIGINWDLDLMGSTFNGI